MQTKYIIWVVLAFTTLHRCAVANGARDTVATRLGAHRFLHGSSVQRLSFTPEGSIIFAVTSTEACMWHVETGKKMHSFRVPSSIMCAAMSADGTIVAVAENGSNRYVYNASTGKRLHVLRGADKRAHSIALSTDGSLVASGDSEQVVLWDVKSGRVLRRIPYAAGVNALAFSPDAKRLACAGDTAKPIRIYDLDGDDAPVTTVDGGAGFKAWLAFSPDGATLAGSCEVKFSGGSRSSLRLWHSTSGRLLHKVGGSFCAGAFSPDGKRMAASAGESYSGVYDVATGKKLRALPITPDVRAVAFSPDAKLLALGQGTRIRLWSTKSQQEIESGHGHARAVKAAAFSPDGRIIATGGLDNTLIMWSWPDGAELRRIKGVGSHCGIQHLRFSPDGRSIAATAWINHDDMFFVFDTNTGAPVCRFGKDRKGYCPPVFSRDGRTLLTGRTDGSIAMWSARSGEFIREVGKCKGGVQSIYAASDGRTAWWAGEYQGLGLRDLETGKDLKLLKGGHHHSDARLVVSPDENWLAVGSHVWERTGRVLVEGRECPAAISPDGRFLAYTSGSRTEIWEALTRQQIHHFDGGAAALTFSPDNTVLVVASGTEPTVIDMTGMLQNGVLPPLKMTKAEMTDLWVALGSPDPWEAHQAAWSLAATGDRGVAFLSRQMHTATVARSARIEALPLPERVRTSRAVVALERSASPTAVAVLERLATGAPAAALTKEANVALVQLGVRKNTRPDKVDNATTEPVEPVAILLKFAKQLEFLSTRELLAGNSEAGFGVPARKKEEYANIVKQLLESDLPSADLTRALSSESPKVRSLAVIALHLKDDPTLLPYLAAMVDDDEATFPTPSRFNAIAFQLDQVDVEPEMPPMQPQTVGGIAEMALKKHLLPAGITSVKRKRGQTGFIDYWRARKRR
jgi:WD40 repeat protein